MNMQQIVDAIAMVSKTIRDILPGQAVVLLPNRSVLIVPFDDVVEASVESEPTAVKLQSKTVEVTRGISHYKRTLLIPLVQFLLREEVLPVGRTTRALAIDLGFTRSKLERLIRLAVDSLPFLMKNGSLAPIRIRPGMEKDAIAWVQEVPSEKKSHVLGSNGKRILLADSTFFALAAKIIYLLLKSPTGTVNSTILTQETGANPTMLKRLRQRIEATDELPFIRVDFSGFRGRPSVLSITDYTAAEQWLSDQTEPFTALAD